MADTAVEQEAGGRGETRGLRVGLLARLMRSDKVGLVGALAGVIIAFSFLSPYFLLTQNFLNIGRAISYTGITAATETLVIIGGGLDLSIGAVMGLSGTVCAALLLAGVPWFLVIPVGVALGTLVGAVNGVIITYVGINPLIVTLGTQFVIEGAAYLAVNSQEIVISEPHFLFIGQGQLIGMPFPVLLLLLAFALVWWWLRYTAFGKHIYAIGGSPGGLMAQLAGIRINRRRMQMYILSGTFAAISGVVLAAFTGTGLPYAGEGLELTIIASVILGGAALTGGRGTVIGTLIGVILLGMVNNGLSLLSVSNEWQLVVQGGALLLAVVVDEFRQKRRSR